MDKTYFRIAFPNDFKLNRRSEHSWEIYSVLVSNLHVLNYVTTYDWFKGLWMVIMMEKLYFG